MLIRSNFKIKILNNIIAYFRVKIKIIRVAINIMNQNENNLGYKSKN